MTLVNPNRTGRRRPARLLRGAPLAAVLGATSLAGAATAAPGPSDQGLIAFEHRDFFPGTTEPGPGQLQTMAPDGTGLRTITSGNDDEGASFSPDGRRVWFTRDQLESGVNHNGIFVMRTDGTGLRRITDAGDVDLDEGPQVSPDGKRVVFTREADGGEPHMMLMNVDGSGLRALLPDVVAANPDWSPDGRRIAFQEQVFTDTTGVVNVGVVDADGSHFSLVEGAPNERFVFQPAWSPDGRQLAYGLSEEGHCDLFRIGLRPPRPAGIIHDQDGCNVNPSWSRSPRAEDD
jgi:Tol biopolymer transport system component